MSVQLQINQAVWVQVVGGANNSGASGVIALATSDRVGIRFDDFDAPAGLVPGCSVRLRLVNEQGVHTGVASVAQVTRKPQVAVMLRAPLQLATTQNRKFVRVPVKLPVHCTVRTSKDEALIGSSDDAAKAHDLSAGGMRLSTALPLRVGDEIELVVKRRNLRSTESELKLVGRVLRVAPGEKKPRVTIVAGIEFVHANQREQDALVLLVFELQRKSLA